MVIDGQDTARQKYVTIGQLTSDNLRVIKEGITLTTASLSAASCRHGLDKRCVLRRRTPSLQAHRRREARRSSRNNWRHQDMRISHFFIYRPIFASVVSIIFVILGGVAFPPTPRRTVSGDCAADDHSFGAIPGCQCRRGCRYGGRAD